MIQHLSRRALVLLQRQLFISSVSAVNSGRNYHLQSDTKRCIKTTSLRNSFFANKYYASPSVDIKRLNFSTSNMASEKTTSQPAPATLLSSLSGERFKNLMDNIDAVMFDCDGVIWHGMDPLKNAQALCIKLRAMGKKVFFITNNSNRTREEFLDKFNTLGFEATVGEIVGTAYLTALYLQDLKFKKKVYLIGPLGVTKELDAVGIECLPIGPDVVPPTSMRWNQKDYANVKLDPDVGAVVVAFDQHFSYIKMLKAASYLKNENCLFIATNTDEQFPGAGSVTYPGTGTFVNAVKTAAAREPIVLGKPERFPFELVSKQHSLQPQRVLMVGDRGNTDILFGKKCELQTLLVLSGVTDIDMMHRWEKSEDPIEKLCVPDYYSQNVDEFYNLLLSV